MLLDMLTAVARRDYEQRRERQRQGINKAQKENIRGVRSIRLDTMQLIGCSIAVVLGARFRKLLVHGRGTISSAVKSREDKRALSK